VLVVFGGNRSAYYQASMERPFRFAFQSLVSCAGYAVVRSADAFCPSITWYDSLFGCYRLDWCILVIQCITASWRSRLNLLIRWASFFLVRSRISSTVVWVDGFSTPYLQLIYATTSLRTFCLHMILSNVPERIKPQRKTPAWKHPAGSAWLVPMMADCPGRILRG